MSPSWRRVLGFFFGLNIPTTRNLLHHICLMNSRTFDDEKKVRIHVFLDGRYVGPSHNLEGLISDNLQSAEEEWRPGVKMKNSKMRSCR